MHADTAPVIAGSLMAWRQVAADWGRRADPSALPAPYSQLRVWHDLTISGRDPNTYVRPYPGCVRPPSPGRLSGPSARR
jgi:hypothetical protein